LEGDPLLISKDSAPALGDVRQAGRGVVIVLTPDARERQDWGRYLDALTGAINRGATVGTRE
jgi:hypothetical protein